jgi:serine/threonine protein kinase/Tfp pilus assembly protein PilF
MSQGTNDAPHAPHTGEQREEATQRAGRGQSKRGVRPTQRGATEFQPPEVGAQVFGFRLRSELGRGAYARVYLAEQADLAGRPVVLKVSAIDGDEPQTLAQLQHTNIVPIYSVHEDIRAGMRAVCMPYFGGASLSKVLGKVWADAPRPTRGAQLATALDATASPPPGPPDGVAGEGLGSVAAGPTALDGLRAMDYTQAAAWVVERLAQALQHAHQRGVIHRDIKPSNILLGADGQPMLLDFNVAERTVRGKPRGALGGTAAYMAPEHLQAMTTGGADGSVVVDHRADIYSLGMVLFEMLVGGRPFDQTGSYSAMPTQLRAMAQERVRLLPSLRQRRPDAPWALESIIRMALAPGAARRYQRAEDLAEDLRRFLADLPLKFAPELSLRERADKWLRRHPRLTSSGTVATAAAALLLVTAFALAGVRSHLAAAREELAAAQAQDAGRRFREGTTRALCLVNTTTEVDDHRKRGAALCEESLALFGVLDDADWQRGPAWRHLSADERAGLVEDVRELLVLLAGARVSAAPKDEAVLRDALGLLDRAQAIDGLPPSRALWEDRARYLEGLGRADEAKAARETAESTPPTTARDHYLLAASYARAGDPAAAVAELDLALDLNPRHYWALTQRGICHLALGQTTEAVADFAACTGLWPEFAWGYFNLGYAREKAGDRREAARDYTTALKRDPQFVLAYLNRGFLQSELKVYEPALADLRRAAGLGRDDAYLHVGIGVTLEALGRGEEADAEFAAAFARAENEPRAVRVRTGWAYGFAVAKRLPDRALEAFEGVLALDPDEPQALYGRGMLLMQMGRTDDALVCFNRVVEVAPRMPEGRRYRAILLARAGKFAPAAEDVNWCLRECPEDGAAYYAAACVAALASESYADPAASRQAADQALEFLKKAVAKGYGRAQAPEDPDLKAVHGRSDFAELLKQTGGEK